jgi:hypothetical protein
MLVPVRYMYLSIAIFSARMIDTVGSVVPMWYQRLPYIELRSMPVREQSPVITLVVVSHCISVQ